MTALRHCLWLLVLTAGIAQAESGLQYRAPDGWIDLTNPATDTRRVPAAVVQEARSGKYVVYAVDPAATTPDSAPVSMNAMEQPQTGVITEAALHEAVEVMTRQIPQSGFTYAAIGTRLSKLGSVTIGIIDGILTTPRGQLRLVQYAIPGRTRSVVVSYGCPVADFDRYGPIFQASAEATTGVYDHSGIDWRESIMVGSITGAVVGVLALIAKSRRKGVAVARAVAATATWDCPQCKRRVPLRIAECRCGAMRP